MVRQKNSGDLMERPDFINEYVEEDEEEYKNYLSRATKRNRSASKKDANTLLKVEKEVVTFFEKIG